MPDEALLTLRHMAQELGLPESTARYYRDAYLDHIPSVGTGRRRRYPREAVSVLRSIARSYAAGRSRPDIVAALGRSGTLPPATAAIAVSEPKARALEEVSNLDLLAAILDGEREQRDALWQMAKEIVRLTDVLQGQDKVLVGIADRAGIAVAPAALGGAAPTASLGAGTPAADPDAAASSPPRRTPEFTPPPLEAFPATAATAGLAPAGAPRSDIENLKAELEAERALVERLRVAKLDIEHRAADAEAALAEQRPRRSSVIGRILGVRES